METINARALSHISAEILNGRPLWGLLWASRYFAQNSGLLKAFLKKAKAQMQHPRYLEFSDLIAALEQGLTLDKLAPELQARIRNFRETRTDNRLRYKFKIAARHNLSTRNEEIRKIRAVSGRR